MHAPDGFLNATTAITTGVISGATIAYALRSAGRSVGTDGGDNSGSAIPLSGMMAAFVFAAQMINVPIAAGTTGHLIGGALAAVLLGPWLSVLVMTVVVATQALLFADGGITALGYNLLNLAIIAPLGGYGFYSLARRLLARSPRSLTVAAGLAGAGSVMASAAALSVEWLFGATAPVPFDRVAVAMLGVHAVVALGEGVLTALIVRSVVAVRPDLVPGTVGRAAPARSGRSPRPVMAAGLVTAALLGLVASQFAAQAPDGLERFILDNGVSVGENAGPFSDYAVTGLADPKLSLAAAAALGLAVVGSVTAGLVAATRTEPGRGTSSTRSPVSRETSEPAGV